MTPAEMLLALKNAGMKNPEIAWRCGLSRDHVWMIRQGTRTPTPEQQRAIERLYRCEIAPRNTVCGPPLRGKLGHYV